MTNPTLERAAISVQEVISDAFFDSVEPDPKEIARAVLMAVLPELKRYDPYEHHGSYDENQSDNGPWVKYDDLTAILAEGE